MTLIEVLLEYQRLLLKHNRQAADTWMRNAVDRSLWWDIAHTFNDKGNFLDATGAIMDVVGVPPHGVVVK